MMWRLPQLPVSIDGRIPLYGTAEIERSIGTWNGEAYWMSDPELSSARVVIGGAKGRLVLLLRRIHGSNWRTKTMWPRSSWRGGEIATEGRGRFGNRETRAYGNGAERT